MKDRSLSYGVILVLLLGCVMSGCGGGGGDSSDTQAASTAQIGEQTDLVQQQVQAPAQDPEKAQQIQDLIRKLRSSDQREAYDAILKLGMMGDETAVEPLLSMYRRGDEHMRKAALRALGSLGDPRALDLVKKGLRSRDLTTRRNAAAEMGNFKDNDAAIEPLIRLLRDDDGWVRMNAQGSLEKITRQKHQTYDAWKKWYREKQSSR